MTTSRWTADTDSGQRLGITVTARDEVAARRKIEAAARCGVGRVYRDEEAEAAADLPDCACGWSGTGTGRNGAIAHGDRCPACGAGLD